MENLDENQVPKAWVGREVVVKTRGLAPKGAEMFGKLEDVHEGGVVLSWAGSTRAEAEMGPVLFYPWNAIEVLRLRVARPERPETREEPQLERLERTGAGGSSQRLPTSTEPKLVRVVPIAQHSSAAGIVVTLRSFEIYEGGQGLIGYLLSPGPEHRDRGRLTRYSFPEVRVRDDQGRCYEARAGNVVRASSGELWLASLPEADAAELEVEVVRMFMGPSGQGRAEHLNGPWIFRFPL